MHKKLLQLTKKAYEQGLQEKNLDCDHVLKILEGLLVKNKIQGMLVNGWYILDGEYITHTYIEVWYSDKKYSIGFFLDPVREQFEKKELVSVFGSLNCYVTREVLRSLLNCKVDTEQQE